MIQPPRIGRRMREYRRTCGFCLYPPDDGLAEGLPDSVHVRALRVIQKLFSEDPYRPLGPELLASLRADGCRISGKMFGRVVDALREKGWVVGEQLHPRLLAGWEREWRRCEREGRGLASAPAPAGEADA